MCDVHVYFKSEQSEEKLLESVERVEVIGNQVTMKNIFGEEKTLQGRIILFDSSLQKILIEQSTT